MLLQAWPASGVLTYAVGPDQLGLAALAPGRTLKQYTVRLLDGQTNQLLTEPYVYILDYAPRPYARQFAYINSLGAVDVITTWGKGSTEYDLVSQQALRPLSLPFAADEGTGEVYEQTLQDKLTVATGFRPLGELKAWRDFYRSTQKWWLKRPLNRLVVDARLPLVLNTNSIRETKDGENLVAHQFEVAPLRQEHYYSPDDDVLDEPLPPRAFLPAGNVTITQTTVVQARDPTISDAARQLTQTDLTNLNRLVSYGNFNDKGFVKQELTDQFYRSKEDPIDIADIADLTTTVYTRSEIDQQLRLIRLNQAKTSIRIRATE